MPSLIRFLKPGLIALSALLLYGCGGGDEYNGFDSTVQQNEPNRFLTFFNRQGELAAGQYTLVVATTSANQAASFSVLVNRNDGSADQLLTGNWTDSFGPSTVPAATCTGTTANVCLPINIPQALGATFTLNTSADGLLYLLDDSNTAQLVGQTTPNGSGVPVTLNFDESNIDKPKFARAYYAAIDPANARDTLQKYRSLHGFDNAAGPDVHVIFRDSKDLGYGRDMFMRSYPNVTLANGGCGGQVIAFYVQNFSVSIIDGFAYGPVNLEGAIEQDFQYHFGSNAIEFSRGIISEGDVCSAEPMAKFYTYRSDYSTPDAVHPRIETIDLDARGEKAMPQPCITCHGGKLRPLDRLGRLVAVHASDPATQIGDTKSHLQAFEVDTFEFSDKPGHTKVEAEESLRKLNAAVFCSYPGSAGHAACTIHGGGVAARAASPSAEDGEWSGDFSREMLLGWYGNKLEVAGTSYDNSFVPSGWQPKVGVTPSGADALFKKVVGPNCFVCHGKQGVELGSNNNANGEGKDLDFSSWTKFISHAQEIERLVFDEGKMPLGLLNYNNFWGDPDKAELLASFIAPYVTTGFSTRHQDANGKIILPGRVLARAGLDRITLPNAAITLNAGSSLYATSYHWNLLSSPTGSVATISTPGAIRTDFSADLVGDYTLRLTASATGTGLLKTDDMVVRIDSTLAKAPRSLTFYNDIASELTTCANACHSINGGSTGAAVVGVPVWWSAVQPQGIPTSTADTASLGLYEQALVRVNLEDVGDSLILKKSSGMHHYGNQRPGFNATLTIGTGGRSAYDLFVNWISEGAVCGGTTAECPL
jgi:cytochrome c1